MDIKAEEEAALGRGYNCSDCPAGYIIGNEKCEGNKKFEYFHVFFLNSHVWYISVMLLNPSKLYWYVKNEKTLLKMHYLQFYVDVNECNSTITNTCDEASQNCVNTEGGFECNCKDGFRKRGDNCQG